MVAGVGTVFNAQIELPAGGKGKALTVPVSAVIDSGTRRIVLVQRSEGRFEPREVKLGSRTHDYVEVMAGVSEGEMVVVAANFLIDAESNLKAAIGGFGPSGVGDAPGAAPGASSGGAIAAAPGGKQASVGHKAVGTVKTIDAKSGTLSVAHEPVASLNWPAMTMDFKAANDSLFANLKPGAAIGFEFVERAPGEWVITKIAPRGAANHPAAPPPSRQGR